MDQYTDEQEGIRLYLLGLLPERRRREIEERLLTDADLYEELLVVEDELIDRHLAGGLDGRESAAFESHFMCSAERREQVRFSAALRRYVAVGGATADEAAGEATAEAARESGRVAGAGGRRGGFLSWLRAQNAALSFPLAAALLLLVFGVAWVALRGPHPGAARRPFDVALTPDLRTRGGGADSQQVSAPPGTDALRLRLRLTADDFQSYRATLLDAAGATIFAADSLKPERSDGGAFVVLVVPARATPPGEYQLRLDGLSADGRAESADSYRFTVAAP
jgi:hypothetical protein